MAFLNTNYGVKVDVGYLSDAEAKELIKLFERGFAGNMNQPERNRQKFLMEKVTKSKKGKVLKETPEEEARRKGITVETLLGLPQKPPTPDVAAKGNLYNLITTGQIQAPSTNTFIDRQSITKNGKAWNAVKDAQGNLLGYVEADIPDEQRLAKVQSGQYFDPQFNQRGGTKTVPTELPATPQPLTNVLPTAGGATVKQITSQKPGVVQTVTPSQPGGSLIVGSGGAISPAGNGGGGAGGGAGAGSSYANIPSFKYGGGEFRYNPATNTFEFIESEDTAMANRIRKGRIGEVLTSLTDEALGEGIEDYQSTLFKSLSRDPLLTSKQRYAERGLAGSSVEQTGTNELLSMLTERATLGAEGLRSERRQGRLSELAALEQGLSPATASAMNLFGLGSQIGEGRLARDTQQYQFGAGLAEQQAARAQQGQQFGQTLDFNTTQAKLASEERQRQFEQAQKAALPLGLANAGISAAQLNPFGAFNFLKGGK